jgi:hypothetical protein
MATTVERRSGISPPVRSSACDPALAYCPAPPAAAVSSGRATGSAGASVYCARNRVGSRAHTLIRIPTSELILSRSCCGASWLESFGHESELVAVRRHELRASEPPRQSQVCQCRWPMRPEGNSSSICQISFAMTVCSWSGATPPFAARLLTCCVVYGSANCSRQQWHRRFAVLDAACAVIRTNIMRLLGDSSSAYRGCLCAAAQVGCRCVAARSTTSALAKP